MTLLIRLASAQDTGQIQAIYSPIVSQTAISFETEPPTVDEMQRRIKNTLENLPWLVCAQGEKILGYAYAGQHRARAAYRWSVDVSVYIHPQARRRGIGHGLYCSLFKILTLQGFYNAYAGIALPNPASVGLHESLGFKPIGIYNAVGYKLGAWHDVGWWHLPLRSKSIPPDEPDSLQKAQESIDWETVLSAGLPFLQT